LVSSSRSIAVPQHSTESFSADDFAVAAADLFSRVDHPVRQALVVPLVVIVLAEGVDGVAQRSLAEEDHPSQTLLFDRSPDPFDVGRDKRVARRYD